MGSTAWGMCLLFQKGSAPHPGCSWGAALSPSPPSCLCRDIRLIEVTENICKRLLDYNLHKERSGSNRFAKVGAALQSLASLHTTGARNCGSFFLSSGSLASHLHMRPQKLGLGREIHTLCLSVPRAALWGQSRSWAGNVTSRGGSLPLQGMSETFETLHNLVHKGVKVVMDIPYELWNETSAEVADLKKQVPARRGQPAAALQAGGGSVGAGRTRRPAPTPRAGI